MQSPSMTSPRNQHGELEFQVRMASVLEASAPKAGNVHPGASFEDLQYEDFLASADRSAGPLSQAATLGVGAAVLEAVYQTHQTVGRNTNLGISLLVAPLCAVPAAIPLREGIETVLANTTVADARAVYAAIQLIQPGGMGKVDNQAVSNEPTACLRDVMRLAAHRDSIAAEYAEGFPRVLQFGVPILIGDDRWSTSWPIAVSTLALRLMAEFPDTLIARKCGADIASQSSRLAKDVISAGWPEAPESHAAFQSLDTWLRADGHRRNPGTTADLVTAILLAAFRDEELQPPAIATLPPLARAVFGIQDESQENTSLPQP